VELKKKSPTQEKHLANLRGISSMSEQVKPEGEHWSAKRGHDPGVKAAWPNARSSPFLILVLQGSRAGRIGP